MTTESYTFLVEQILHRRKGTALDCAAAQGTDECLAFLNEGVEPRVETLGAESVHAWRDHARLLKRLLANRAC